MLIEGEAGIGKTRLLHECLVSESLRDRTVLVATCPPLPEPFPLGPVVDALRRLWHRVEELELSPLGGALQPLFPEWAEQLPPALEPLDHPKETRHRVLRALTELVERLAVDVLVVEDAHWADSATLEWLLMLTAAGDLGPSVIVTYRPTDVPEGSTLLRLTSRPQAGLSQIRFELAPLDVEQAQRLVGSMLGTQQVSEEFAAFLHERTDGIPLALEEMVRLLRERHDIIRRRGSWTRRVLDELEVPPTVRDSVLERVDRLDTEARQVLRAAATLAEPADEALLVVVADLGEQAVRRGIARGLAAGLLREAGGGCVAFRHVLDAKAVEEAILAPEQWRLHRRAAQALGRAEPQPVVRLARHFREAGDTESWCHYAEASAELAAAAGDDRTAVTVLLELLAALEHPAERRARLARRLGEAAFFGAAALGELERDVVEVLREVLTSGELDRGERGELRLLLGRMLWRVGEGFAAFAEFEAAIPDLGHRPDLTVRAMANLALPLVREWPAARHLRWLDQAADLVRDAGSPSDQLAFTVNRATALLLLGEDAGWQAVAELPESVADPTEQRLVASGLMNVAEATLAWGRYDATRRYLEAIREYIQEIHYQRFVSTERVVGAYLDWYTGCWRGLSETADDLAASDDTELVYQLRARQILGLLELVSGARAKAERYLGEVAEQYGRRGVAEPEAVLAPAALGRLWLSNGAASQALGVTASVVEMIERKGVWLWATDVAPVHVSALINAGRLREAESFVAEFSAGLAGRHAPAPATALTVCRGVLAEAHGELDRAAALFADAASAWAVLPRPYDELLAREQQGSCLLTAGDQDEGSAVLSDTEQRLRRLGAKWDADRVAHLLRLHGVDVVRTWRRGPRGYGDHLSPREMEVVGLVARGMTNKQIAATLFISPRTVGQHLSAAMRKLVVSSRTALAMAASEAGLLTTEVDQEA